MLQALGIRGGEASSSSTSQMDLPSPNGETSTSQRRVMPARLRRVSSMLTGSIIEEEIAGAAAANSDITPFMSATVLLTNRNVKCEAIKHFTVQQQSTRAVETIPTPDFRTRDDTEMMGKTRGIRSEEDTSDAAYERRHRKADNAEKRLRRWEKENLKKDRQRIVDRIDQLKLADVRTLAPILTARQERSNKSEQTVEETDNDKLESLRRELVNECKALLKRYDLLLTVPAGETSAPSSSLATETLLGKRKKLFGGVNASTFNDNPSTEKPRRSISVSGAFAGKSLGRKSSLRASTSSSSLPVNGDRANAKRSRTSRSSAERSRRPFTDVDGKVRAEHTYANIHARTSGGRFAPKTALRSDDPNANGSRSKVNTKTANRTASGSEKKRRKSSESESKASAVKKTSMPTSKSQGSIRKSKSKDSVNTRSTSENGNSNNASRKVKLIVGKRSKSGRSSSDAQSAKQQRDSDGDQIMLEDDSEGELDASLSSTIAAQQQRSANIRSQLSYEEAQELIEKALATAEGSSSDEEDAAAAAAEVAMMP